LYKIGTPDSSSPVLVTANYKLTFDVLRSELADVDAWILVLDTNGVNVWCAAGKGTFGTEELVRRMQATGLSDVVSHRKLVVPQLGATGVAAHEVRRLCGFKVVYGPVRASDITAFLEAGMTATSRMRQVTFTVGERFEVIGVELASVLKWIVPIVVVTEASRSSTA
jgi:CO dehydrogenase/acetyl-CoA synthase gamma subunit (corrinoid Fe-S protein)